MIASHLPMNSAMQSLSAGNVLVTAARRVAGGLALLVESRSYPSAKCVRVGGLLPGRHYLLDGAAHRFVRADAAGEAWIDARLTAPTLVTMATVI